MRFAAQRNMSMQDNLPANGTVYMPNIDTSMGSMMKALRDWEKRRGLEMTYKGKYIENRPKKQVEEKPKAEALADRLAKDSSMPAIKVPRDLEKTPRQGNKPGPKPTLTKEERKQRKNENNRLYRIKHNAEARARSKNWRANQSPEQRAKQLERVKTWKAKKKAERELRSV